MFGRQNRLRENRRIEKKTKKAFRLERFLIIIKMKIYYLSFYYLNVYKAIISVTSTL